MNSTPDTREDRPDVQHGIPWDTPGRGVVVAYCGAFVHYNDTAPRPTCPACLAVLAYLDQLDPGLPF